MANTTDRKFLNNCPLRLCDVDQNRVLFNHKARKEIAGWLTQRAQSF
jgi:hypothetical protein